MLKKDMVLKPGQRVRVVRTISVAYDLDISDYLDGEDDLDGSPITVKNLEWDIENNTPVEDIWDDMDDRDVTDIETEITEIL